MGLIHRLIYGLIPLVLGKSQKNLFLVGPPPSLELSGHNFFSEIFFELKKKFYLSGPAVILPLPSASLSM